MSEIERVEPLEPFYTEFAVAGNCSAALAGYNDNNYLATEWQEYGRVTIPPRMLFVCAWGFAPPFDWDYWEEPWQIDMRIGWVPADPDAVVMGQAAGSDAMLDDVGSDDTTAGNFTGPDVLIPLESMEVVLRWQLVTGAGPAEGDPLIGREVSREVIMAGVKVSSS